MEMTQHQTIVGTTSQHRQFGWMIAGVWSILALFMGGQLYVGLANTPGAISWYTAVLMEFSYCAMWVLLAPLTLWLLRRFPFTRKAWVLALIVHLIAAVTISSATMGVRAILGWYIVHAMKTPLTLQGIFYNMSQAFDYGAMSYMLNLLLGYSFEHYRNLRAREVRAAQLETELSRAQLEALKMQLHPHFLFNTLNAISMLIRKGHPDDAVETISRLSKFLRHTLENIHSQEVTLAEELELLDLYLSIQKVRFGEALTVTKEIAPETLLSKVPTLILQPLVENALRHGIAMREGAGRLTIAATRENGVVHLSVRDDGAGLSPGWNQGAHSGIGIRNTVTRLAKLYGAASAFHLQAANGAGAIAELTLPYHEQQVGGE
jgi:sensor histidine kinase YesM